MNLKTFISDFLKRSGAHVFNAMFLAKIIGFGISIAMARLLTQADYGDFTYAFTAVSFLIPFMGFGAYQSLVYFGAKLNSDEEKKQLFSYAFSRGILFSIILAILLIVFSPLITRNRPDSELLLMILSFHLITFSLIEFVRNYSRLIDRNKIYAQSENVYNVLLLVLAIIAAWFFQSLGYAWMMVLVPFIVGFYYLKRLNIGQLTFKKNSLVETSQFWKYGMFVSLGAVAAKMMYIVDIITIGNFLPRPINIGLNEVFDTYVSEQLAIYKICSIIPIAAFVLPLAIVTTDFLRLAEKSTDKHYLTNYARNTIKLLLPISVLIALVLHFGSEYVLWIFGEQYRGNGELISVFALAVIGAFTFRIPFGNMLSAVGKANWNAYISFFVLTINVVLNYYMVQSHGILGAAWATTILIWLSGVVNYVCFRVYLRSLD